MVSCDKLVLLWVLITILIMIIAFILFTYLYIDLLKLRFINQFSNVFNNFCANIGPEFYRQEVYIPEENGVYEKSLSTALLDISLNVTRANCFQILPLRNPPGFNQQLRIEGIEPFSGQETLVCYIFWNIETRIACIAFTGTATLPEWRSDFEYQQVAPTQLNNYQEGMLMHKGFYDIYIAVRNQIWGWWNINSNAIDNLFITGHSLGGALSNICSFDFSLELDNRYPIFYSFASPRVGNSVYAQRYNALMPTALRVNNTEDIIPQLPPATWQGYNYEHTGQNVPFTISLRTLIGDHITAYLLHMPTCPQVAECNRSRPILRS